MKNIIKGLIIFFAILLVGLIGLMTYALVKGSDELPLLGNSFYGWTEAELINTQNVEVDDISSIDISNSSRDIIFKRGDSDHMVIREYSSKSKDKSFVSISQSSNILKLKSDKNSGRSWFVLRSNYQYYEVYLPTSYQGSMNIKTSSGDIYSETDLILSDYSLSSSSGYVDLQSLTAEKINIATSSGDIDAQYLEGETELSCQSGYVEVGEIKGDIKITTSSGDVNTGRVDGTVNIKTSSGYADVEEGSDTKIETSSGDITISNVNGRLDIKSSSGYVEAENITGGGSVYTTSGDINLEFAELTEDLQIDASSGYVYCDIPKEANFQLQVDTSSGDINTDFDETLSYNKKGNHVSGLIGSAADSNINISTTSGDVSLSYR